MRGLFSRVFSTTVVVVLTLLVVACGQSTTTTGSTGNSNAELKIIVVPKTIGNNYWDTVQAGAQCAANKQPNVSIVWDGTTTETDVTGQITLLQNYITQKPNGIIYAATDAKALVQISTQATQQSIPVENIDSGTNPQPANVPLFATDNTASAAKAADLMGAALNGQGKIAIIEFVKGSATNDQRVNGFKNELAAKYPNIQIVADQSSNSDFNMALSVTQDILSKYPHLDGIFGANDQSATGAAQAVSAAGLTGKVKIVGWDASPTEVKDLQAGTISDLVLQNPFKMGFDSVTAMVKQLRGGAKARTVDTGVTFVSSSNLNDANIQSALNPTCSNQTS
ncbi:MAG: substrate-binding domain-containing protein [Ktedonobacteraceae bacterium]